MKLTHFLKGPLICLSIMALPVFCLAVKEVPNEDQIYNGNIRSLLLFKEGFEMSAPVIRFHSGEHLVLSFDDLDPELKQYRFTITHCESDWTTSDGLMVTDYIEGLQEGRIDDFAYSINTTVSYVHYSMVYPGTDVIPKISGNYILRVYIDDPDEVVFTRRFMVVEVSSFSITGDVHQATNVNDRFTRQEVDFTVNLNGMRLMAPVQEIKVVVTQNDRQDNALRNLKPRFVRMESLDYTYDEENTFNGGNEYRAVDIKSLIYQTERIKTIEYDRTGYNVYLLDDFPRPLKNYTTEKDINGRMVIKSEDHATDSDIEADYAWVYFRLPVTTMFAGSQVYILGALTGWQLSDSSRMEYVPDGEFYTKRLLLKQGYYNYIYVLKDNKTGKTDESIIEGSHWETENEYTVWVYFRPTGGLYDRLVAVQNFNSLH